MKGEEIGAMTVPTMRPSALEAATTETRSEQNEDKPQPKESESSEPQPAPQQPEVPFSQPSHGTATAAKALEDAAHGVKVTVKEVLAWAEEKVEKLSKDSGDTGPYNSQATCAPSDLDPIGSGVLAAVPKQERKSTDESERKGGDEEKERVGKGDEDKEE